MRYAKVKCKSKRRYKSEREPAVTPVLLNMNLLIVSILTRLLSHSVSNAVLVIACVKKTHLFGSVQEHVTNACVWNKD
jgi:hypothetical protein